MNLVESKNGREVTTSLMVAEVFGKSHGKVIRDIKNLTCSKEFGEANFGSSSYSTKQGKELPMYEITKDGFSFLVMGYTGEKASEFKEMFISEFNKREAMLKNDDYIVSRALTILEKRTLALEARLQQKDEQIKLQEHVIVEQAPKVEYHDKVLQSTTSYNTTTIAKELGMSAVALNQKLRDMKIIFRTEDHWVLYHQYQNKGYTETRTAHFKGSNGDERTSISTVWTENGREFIHKKLNPKFSRPSEIRASL